MSDDVSHSGGLRVINITDEARPQVVASHDFTVGGIPWKGTGLDVVGDKVYFDAKDYLYVFNVADPHNPVLETRFAPPTAFVPSLGGHVVVKDNLAYVTVYAAVPVPGQLPVLYFTGGLAIYKSLTKSHPRAKGHPRCCRLSSPASQATKMRGCGPSP